MRILLVTLFFPPNRNAGTETYTLGLAQTLSRRGHEVQVICAGDWENGARYWNGVTEDDLDGVRVLRIHLNWMKARDPNRVLYDSRCVETWIEPWIATNKPDVVHVTSLLTLGVGVLRAIHRTGRPLVLTLMDFWFLCPRTVLLRGDGQLCDGLTTSWECQQCLLTSSNLYQRTTAKLPAELIPLIWKSASKMPMLGHLRGVRGIALNMDHRKTSMREALGLPNIVLSHSHFVQQRLAQSGLSDRVVYLANGHDLRWVTQYHGKSPSSHVRIGYMGQITRIKGVHLLIEAFRSAGLDARAQLDIWGDLSRDTAYAAYLQQLIGDSSAVHLHKRFERDQLASILAEIDVLVVPSLWYENAPLVIQEAFAARTPVIATRLGGMAEAITHGVNGLLFEREDANDLARQLGRLLDEPNLLPVLQEGIPAVKTIAEETTELETLYASLLASRRVPTTEYGRRSP